MATSLEFIVDDTVVKQKLNAAFQAISDFSEPLNDIGDELIESVSGEVFDSEGAATGDKWRALKLSTLQARAHRVGYYANPPIATGKILTWTGRLRNSFKKHVSPWELTIDNPVPYFRYHQKRGGSPPQRRMLILNAKNITKIRTALNDYLVSKIA